MQTALHWILCNLVPSVSRDCTTSSQHYCISLVPLNACGLTAHMELDWTSEYSVGSIAVWLILVATDFPGCGVSGQHTRICLVFFIPLKFSSARTSMLFIWKAVACSEFKPFSVRGSIVFPFNYGDLSFEYRFCILSFPPSCDWCEDRLFYFVLYFLSIFNNWSTSCSEQQVFRH